MFRYFIKSIYLENNGDIAHLFCRTSLSKSMIIYKKVGLQKIRINSKFDIRILEFALPYNK